MQEHKNISVKRLFEILGVDFDTATVECCTASPVYKIVDGIPVIERFDYYFTVSKKAEIK